MGNLKIISLNISTGKGTVKHSVTSVTINEMGIQGDAHAGLWHRQISLLGKESIDIFSLSLGRTIQFGEFGENITTEGFSISTMRPFDRLVSGTVTLEVTQIGKKCHGENCEIFREVGNCIMPKEGIFCRVISGGVIKSGDTLAYLPKVFKIVIITLSDRASRGEYEDKSGPYLQQMTESFFQSVGYKTDMTYIILPDEPETLENTIKDFIKDRFDIIFTTGGTGIGPRDITPDVVKRILDKEIPGIMELIRYKYGSQFPNALLSRSIAGVSGNTLIYTLPGSPKAVKEYCEEIFKTLEHSFRMLYNIDSH